MESTINPHDSPRRCTRIRTQIPLRLTRLDTAVRTSERCYTLVVNPQGCGVRLSTPLEAGGPVEPAGLAGGTRAAGRGANCGPLGAGGKYLVGGLGLGPPGKGLGLPCATTQLGTETCSW